MSAEFRGTIDGPRIQFTQQMRGDGRQWVKVGNGDRVILGTFEDLQINERREIRVYCAANEGEQEEMIGSFWVVPGGIGQGATVNDVELKSGTTITLYDKKVIGVIK